MVLNKASIIGLGIATLIPLLFVVYFMLSNMIIVLTP